MECRWIYDAEIGPWHLPGCWGAVNGGPECCYCDRAEQLVQEGDALAAIEKRLASIEILLRPHP